ncbi:hypothetical protein H8E06_01095 [bacterium]|nr:hypothetical protein [bacterium]
METFSLNGTVLKPLPLKYAYDSDVKIKNFNEYFSSGAVFSFTPVLEKPRDLATNNYANMILSNKMAVSTFVSLTSTAPAFPVYLQTNIRNRDSQYWEIGGASNDMLLVNNYPTGIPLAKMGVTNFEIVLISHIDCVVRTYIDGKLKYLTFERDKYTKTKSSANPAWSFEEAPNIQNELTGFLSGAQTSTDTGLGYSDVTSADTKTRTFSYIYDGLSKFVLLVKGIAPDDSVLKGNNLITTEDQFVVLNSLTGFSDTSVILEGGWLAATRGEHTHGGSSTVHGANGTSWSSTVHRPDAATGSETLSTNELLRITDGSFYYSRIRQYQNDGFTPFTDVFGRQIFEYTFRKPTDFPWFDADNAVYRGGNPWPVESQIDTTVDQPAGGDNNISFPYDEIRLLAVDGSYAPLRSFTAKDIHYIRSKPVVDGLYNIPSRWHSYQELTEDNHLAVNSAKSHNNVKNNFIVAASHNDILSSGVLTNFIPLKNQLTPLNQVARGNPYDDDHDVTFRDYQKMHTGSNQEFGNDNLVLTYTANTSEYQFEPDKLTYFHIPYKTSPYTLLNINHSALIDSGSRAGDSPITSDKVFKKMDKDYTVVFKDEQNGQWLCSWLKQHSDPSKQPAWVDRYYNPYTKTRTEALTAENDGRVYVDKFTTSINLLRTSADDYFDKVSDLTFEPGGYYAYHRVGPKYMNSILDLYKKNQKIDTIAYRNANSFPQTPNTVNNKAEYALNGDRYGQTNDIDIKGSFTLSFDLHCDDWSKPIGNQILGNYTNAGIGFYNDTAVTPFVLIPDGKSVRVYNTSFTLLHIIADIDPKYVFCKGGTNNIFIIDKENLLHEYDTNFVLQNKTNLNILEVGTPETEEYLNDKTIYADQFIDADIDGTSLYINTYANLMSDQKYVVYNYHAENKFYSSYTYTAPSSSTSISITNHGVYIPLSDTRNLNRLTVDSKGNLWQIDSTAVHGVYKTLKADITNAKSASDFNLTTAAVSASTSSDAPESIACDEMDNIWMLHSGNKLTKLDNDRNILFSITLSTTPTSSTRYIDFVREYTVNGLETYAIIINQSSAGANVIKVNMDGTVKDTVSLYVDPTVVNPVKITTFDSNHDQWKSVTGYNYLRKWEIKKQNTITCKFSVQNLYENEVIRNTFKEFQLKEDVSKLKTGWHSFVFRFDAEAGRFALFIDGKKVEELVMNDHRARYSFLNLFKNPIMFGTTPHIGGELFSERLQQKKSYFANKAKVRCLYVYDKPMSDAHVKYISEMNSDIRTLKWNAPAGQRNFIDTVERFFKFDYPGSTSNYVDVVIENTFITDASVRDDVEREVRKVFETVAPSHVKLNNVEFRQNEIIR